MADDLSGIEISQIDALAAIKLERQRIEQLIEKATARKQDVEAPVYERVVRDYEGRIEALEAQARPLRQQARAELAKLRALHGRLNAELQAARMELQETEFRHEVGELPEEEFTQRRQTCQQAVTERTKSFEDAERVLQRFLDVLPATPEPAPVTTTAPAAPNPPSAPGPEPEGATMATPVPFDAVPPPAPAAAAKTDPFGTVVVVGARLVEVKDGTEGRSFSLGTITTIGRTPDNDVAIKERAVSRHHARVALTETGFAITDLNSGNGTFVNGKRATECKLSDGDRIELGDLCFVFRTG